MAAGSLRNLLKPFEMMARMKQRDTYIRFYSAFCCEKIQHHKREQSATFKSDSSNQNVIGSCYPAVELPDVPFHEFVFQNLGQWEDKTAIECNATGKKWKYRDLYKNSKTLASSLQKRFKLKKGDRQAIVLPNCPEYAGAFLAGSMTGVISTTVNPIYTPNEISHQLKLVEPKLLFTTPEIYTKCLEALKLVNMDIPIVLVKMHPEAEIPSGAVSYAELIESSTPVDFTPVDFDLNDDLVIPFSSGTSGLPKGVLLTHKNITANLLQFATECYLKSTPSDKETNQSVILGLLPMFHIYGMVIIAFDGLRCGARIVTLPRFEPKSFVETIYTKKTEILYLAPPLIFFLAHQPMVEEKHLKSVQHVVTGAAPCGGPDLEKLMAKCRTLDVSQGYGMTETSPLITMAHNDRFHKISSVGHPCVLTQVKVVNSETGEALPKGMKGEIRVKGPQVMKGYYKNPEETKKTFDDDGWLRTGDVGYYDDEHDFYIVDRLKELIKVKGFQVAPAELEETLRSHPKIADAGVIGVPHPDLGEVPKAFVVLKEGSPMTETDIQDFIKETLSPYKQLKGGVRIMKAIPKSNTGKILRRQLQKMEESS